MYHRLNPQDLNLVEISNQVETYYQVNKVDLNVVQVEPTRSQPGWDLNLAEISTWLNPRDCQVTKDELNVVQVAPTRSQPG